MPRLLIRNGQVITPTDILTADVLIEDEQIIGLVAPNSVTWLDAEVIDATGCYVMPGLVDPHTHIQLDTGIYKTADDWAIGTQTAAFGGITTVVDFATQFPGMSFPEALDNRLTECQPAYIDYSYHMMVTDPPPDDDAYQDALTELRDLGVPSIKLYTTYRPNYYMDDAALLRTFQAMPEGMLTLVHCENDAIVSAATQRLVAEGKTGWAYHGQGRPWQAEVEAVARVVHLAMMAQATVYIVHCTMPRSLKHINRMRQSYPRVYSETCPQYFTLNENAYTGTNPEHFILQPPLRNYEAMNTMRDSLHLADVISTDHCDYSLAQKREYTNFTQTPGGLPGLETALQLTLHYLTPQEAVLKMSATPAKLFGLYPRKGALLPGSDADIVIYDPRPQVTIHAENLHTIGGYTPYEDMTVQGYVRTTISRGMILVDEGKFYGKIGRGRFLKGTPFHD